MKWVKAQDLPCWPAIRWAWCWGIVLGFCVGLAVGLIVGHLV